MKTKSSSIKAFAVSFLIFTNFLSGARAAELDSRKCQKILNRLDEVCSEATHKLDREGWIDQDYYDLIAGLERVCVAFCTQQQCLQAVPGALMNDRFIETFRT